MAQGEAGGSTTTDDGTRNELRALAAAATIDREGIRTNLIATLRMLLGNKSCPTRPQKFVVSPRSLYLLLPSRAHIP